MASLQDLWAIFNQDETPYQYQQVRGGGDFGAGYNVGSAIAQNIQNARINRRNNQRRNDSRGQAMNGLPGSNGSANGGAVTGAIGADENGVYGIPQQQPTTVIGADANGVYGVNPNTGGNNILYQGSPNWTMPGNGSTKIGQPELNITDQTIGQNYNQRIDSQTQGGFNIPRTPQTHNNGFKSIFGSDSNTGVFGSNPQSPVASSVDQALTGGGTITSASLYGQPQQQRQDMSNLRNIQEWIEADRAQGVTNPIISMMRYQAFMEPMEKQRREDNLRAAFATLRNPDATDADKLNAYALMEYELKKPGLKETMDWAQEQRQMARDEFGHKQELWPLQMEQARLGLDNTRSIINHRNFQDLGDYAGVNLEGKSWVRNNDGVDLSNAQPHTIAGLNHISDIFQQMTGKQLIVTSGNDGNIHAGGQFSHGKGWKVDVSGNGLEDPNIRHQFIQQCENLGIKVLDEYEHPSPNSTGGHLDLQFSGYRGNVTGRRGKSPYGSAIDKQALKAQQNFEKNTVGMRKSAMALAGLQNIDPNDEKSVEKYEKGMDDFAKQIEGLYDSYGLNGNKMDSTRLGIALYHELNETRSGLRPETLAEGVARAIYAKRGDVSPEELQRSILAEVYGNNGGGEQSNQQTTTNTPTDKTLQESDNRRMDRLVNGDLQEDDSEGVLVTSDGRRFTDSQLNARDMFLKERHVNPQYKSGSTWWNGMFSI